MGGGLGAENTTLYPNTPRGAGAREGGRPGGSTVPLGAASLGSSAGKPQISAPVPKYQFWQGVPFQHHPVTRNSRFLQGCPAMQTAPASARWGWELSQGQGRLRGPQPWVRDGARALGSAPSPRGGTSAHSPSPACCAPRSRPPPVGNGSGEGQTRSAVRHGQVSPTPTEGGCLCPRRARGGGPTPTPCGPAGAQGTSPRTARGPPATPERGLCRSPTYSSMSMGQESGTAAAWRGESRRHVVSPAGYGQYSHGEGQRHGGTRGTGAGAAPVTGTVGEKEPRAPGTVDIACNDPGRGDRQSLGPAHRHPRHQGHSRWCAGRG